jgi:dynein heavy chain
MYGMFIERVRESLHIALAFSPIGDNFKRRARVYPSLINCCTIDCYTSWPDGELLNISNFQIILAGSPYDSQSYRIME